MLGVSSGAAAAAPALELAAAAPGEGAALAEGEALADAAEGGSPEPSKNLPGMTSVGAPGSDE